MGDSVSARGLNTQVNESVMTVESWKEQCLAELQSRQRTADKAIRTQVKKIEDQKVSRECRFEDRLDRISTEANHVRQQKE